MATTGSRDTQASWRALAAILMLAALPPSAHAVNGPYGIKSGMVETTSDAFGPSVTREYFDDYGARSARVIPTPTMGQTSYRLEIHLPEGAGYDIDLDQKSGTSAPGDAAAAMAQLIKNAKVKPLPPQRFLGKQCLGRQYDGAEGTVRIWSWKGIALRTEMGTIVIRATRLSEEAVPAETFTVPAGVRIQDPPH